MKSLEKHRVEYLVIGGYAVGAHGHPHTTTDLGLWIGTTPRNAERAAHAIREFGFDQHDSAGGDTGAVLPLDQA